MDGLTLGSRTFARRTGGLAGGWSRPYVIAEIGVNHEGSLDLARKLIDLAKAGGADAAKFQTYKAGRIASRHSPAYWDVSKEPTPSQHALFQKYDAFGPEEYAILAEHSRNVGIDFVSTPFDLGAVDLLDPLMGFFKIASADLTNVPLLRQVAAKGKPVVLSTGAATLGEIDMALDTLRRAGATEIALLHCVLNYPCPDANAHLNMIEGLQRSYPELAVGYSDHTVPDEAMLVLTAAWLKGAVILEKHFTHDKTLPGNDHYHAMDAEDLRRFLANVDRIGTALGAVHKAPLPDEEPARRHARRSIVADRPIATGEVLGAHNLTCKRPAHGISPLYWDEVVGRRTSRAVAEDTPLQWADLEPM